MNKGKNKKFNFITGGDDFLVVCKDKNLDADIFLEEFKEKAKELGMEFKFARIKNFTKEKIEERPCFYKYTIDRNEAIIPTSSLLERCFCPWNKQYKDGHSIFKFLFDLMPSLGRPSTSHLIYYLLLIHISSMLFAGKPLMLEDIVKIHIGVYEKVCNRVDGRISFKEQEPFDFAFNYFKIFGELDRNKGLWSGFEIFNLFP